MNATPISNSNTNSMGDNNSESDSDANPDVAPQHYQRISVVDYDDDDDYSDQGNSDEDHHSYSRGEAENVISSLQLNGDVEHKSSSDEEEEEVERMREISDSAMLRAFREDDNRRNAPLTAENATRVREAMRGVSFGGSAPDWVGRIPEDQWIDRLRRLRQPPPPSPPTSVQN